ncbi:2-hydroxychromene-2-carboxylate isomerase [Massilia horti]|uniref:2-hydroxychromene-2-carboxylate isomerase n=1 Tax=Massilia horti TaxID=2562153 RepID=A0A4Y9T0F2_9BURK|nr:2-hydroxychromene-2-carboxylate isomerase [Massilia horti]TFW32536.1 2-hydroxychromene-2-carboxylate isomerase [Massilia horti]
MSKVIQYFFAPQSPWTYLGHDRLLTLARQYGAQVEPRPFDLARVFGLTGGLPLAKRPPERQAYRLQELRRWSDFLGLRMNVEPKFFPVAPELASRLIIAARDAAGADTALALAGAIMRAVWAEEKNIADPATLSQLAVESGLDAPAVMQAAQQPKAEEQYQRNTDDALAAGVFGVPWYVVDGQGFWGQDRLDFVERHLQQR